MFEKIQYKQWVITWKPLAQGTSHWVYFASCLLQNILRLLHFSVKVAMWQKFQNAPTDKKEDDNVPPFLDKYIEYKFGLFDRTGKVIHIWCVLNPGRLKKTVFVTIQK